MIKQIERRLACIAAAVVLTIAMAASILSQNVFADENQAVQDAANGVFQVNLEYTDDIGNVTKIASGSGFLINDDTVVTCAHVLAIDDTTVLSSVGKTELEYLADLFGKSKKDFLNKVSCSVTISRDVTCGATIETSSEDVDFAILKLDTPIQNKTPLALRDSDTVKQTEDVYALGFPSESSIVQDIDTFTADDVTITNGKVNKVATGSNLYSLKNADYIQTSVKLTGGNSGGPMVDDNGYVIGICEGSTGQGWDSDDYFYAISINQVIEVLDGFGIEYTPASDESTSEDTPSPSPTPTPEVVKADTTALSDLVAECEKLTAADYTEESYNALLGKEDAAKAVISDAAAAQEDVDAAVEELTAAKEGLVPAQTKILGLSLPIFIVICVAIVVVIVIIILLIVMSGKKKNKTSGSSQQYNPNLYKQQTPVETEKKSLDTVIMGGDETTVLSSAGETTVLRRNVNGGSLINSRTNERVDINLEEFKVGRERTNVNYCITGNTSIGRVHAKFVVRGGKTYLVDNASKNGTFINGSKCMPNQENVLKSGDKISFADEEFIYQA